MHEHIPLDELKAAYQEGQSSLTLAKRYGVAVWSILHRLRKMQVEIRPDGVRQTLGLTSDQRVVFRTVVDGLLLGDGSICTTKPSMRFEQSEPRRGWVLETRDLLRTLGVSCNTTEIPEKTKVIEGRLVVKKPSVVLFTGVTEEIRAERQRWYPKGKKVVPPDVDLSPRSLAYWFSGDGSYDKAGALIFYTNSFSRKEVQRLAVGLQALGIDAHCVPAQRPREHKIVIAARDSAVRFKALVGPYMPECCLYKLQHVRPTLTSEQLSSIRRKLTPGQVEELLAARKRGEAAPELAAQFGVSVSTIYNILRRSQ